MLVRLLIVAAFAAAVTVPSAQAAPVGPTGLRGFLLRADEPAQDTFPRTPAFAWAPYPGARGDDRGERLRRRRAAEGHVHRRPRRAADERGREYEDHHHDDHDDGNRWDDGRDLA